MGSLKIKPIEKEDMRQLWQIGFAVENPEWSKWNGPYYDDYKAYTFEEFCNTFFFYNEGKYKQGIYVDDVLVGMLFRYWEDEKTRWLEIGIVIYDENYWGKGFGTQALREWISDTFDTFDMIEHIGLTTWSGNERMMKSSKKLGLKQEARIRKVRYWQGVYYDSVKYGVLREEWGVRKNSLS
ncbi:GNAT family protein [Streptococcus sp. NLN76]|uniref:GNAT family N-acetyltransferase n=1 Tax=Streptococcus sp. NLN76 TaxID=2822800 RepID=UPI0018A8D213|nr:GNAT family protein [Streptococcus sp. NLN76]MBF8969640.1 GNAT family N-acetyltransferase [Streptococcus sp. NLN76]